MQNDSTSSLNEAISFVLHHPRAKGIFPTASGLGLSFDSDTSLEKTQLHHNHTTSAPVQPHPHHTHRSSRPPTAPGSVISQQSYTHPTAPSVSSRHSNKTSPIQPPQVPIVGKSRSQSATNASSATSTTSGGTRTTAASYLQHSQQSANADHEYIKKLETQIQTLRNERKEHQNGISKLQKQLQERDQTISTLRQQLEETNASWRTEYNEKEVQLKKLQLLVLQTENEAQEKVNAELMQQKLAQEQVQRVEDQLQQVQQQLLQTTQMLEATAKERVDLANQLEDIKNVKQTHSAQVQQYNNTIKELTDELAQIQRQHTVLCADYQNLKEERSEQEFSLVHQKDRETNILLNRLVEKDLRVEALEKRLKESQGENLCLQEQIDANSWQLNQLNTSVAISNCSNNLLQ
eukprot:TRINITY_DN68121_c2_g1_i3.p1 TRINITY_DN68121_c2_g1~~TRINITY_DN68121_c2_g1_i3.p1  ORF type:complete len:406 (-),score=52.74 TRINITY_DN68121_c2_g1_i3:260-1477(-)